MEIEDKITIIEGPPPTFEAVNDGWALGLHESPRLYEIVLTRLRTFNGPALVERCHRAWRNKQQIHLEFRSDEGLEQQAPITAARNLTTDAGDMLLLWIRLDSEEVELELQFTDDELDYDDLDDVDDDEFDFDDPDENDDLLDSLN